MASISYPRAGYNSGAITSLQHERLVRADKPDGLDGYPTDTPLVYADGAGTRVVKIVANRGAWLRGSRWWSEESDISMPSLAANSSGQPRLDLIVLRLDRSDYTVVETAITGTPAASPVAPSPVRDLGGTGTYDLPIATVLVANGATGLASNTVTDIAWYVGDDGQIYCRSAARPPHQLGRVINEVDTGRTLVSTGLAWLRAVEDAGPATMSLNSGWTALTNVWRRRNGIVTGSVMLRRSSTIGASTTVTPGTAPAGYRPTEAVPGYAILPGPNQVVAFDVTAAGVITIGNGDISIGSNRSIVANVTWPAS